MTFYDWTIGWIKFFQREDASLESRFSNLERKVNEMSDVLDTLKADFEAYQTKVGETLKALNDKIAGMTAGLDPAKAQAIDDEVKAAIAALAPPAA